MMNQPDMSDIAEVDASIGWPPVATRPLIRELAGWPMMLPFASRVVALQGAHPTVAKGLLDHSTGFTDPFGRVQRTFDYTMRILFGDERAVAAAEIRDLHRPIKGTGFDGKPYHAWNREAWTWVHLTTFEAMLYGIRAIGGDPSLERQQALYDEVKTVGMMYGVRREDMPDDIAGLHSYIRHGIATKLTYVPDVRFAELLKTVPPVSRVPIPTALWRVIAATAGRPVEVLIAGSFPSTVRKRWGIRWTPLHEAQYQAALVALRTVTTPLPDRLRMVPYAYRALHSAA